MRKLDISITQIISYAFAVILIIGNVFALISIVRIFNQITQNKGSVSQTSQITQIQPFNATLYTQLQKERSTRQLYTSNSHINALHVPEVFGSN